METAKGATREESFTTTANQIDAFERYNQPHSRFIAELATKLAQRFGLTQPDVNAIAEAALLHDVGLAVMKPPYHSAPRPLNFEERMDLWRHPILGEQEMAKRGATRHAQLLVRWHHEWWDGSGYPDMLAFEDITVGARILRAVELYSALLCDRPYRQALPPEQALEALESSAGIECDPYVVKALVALIEEKAAPGRAVDPEFQLAEAAPEPAWRAWRGSRYNKKSLLGFEASVLRQIDFRSIAIPFCGPARLDWYLKVWGKLVLLNDPRSWAAEVARAMIEGRTPLSEPQLALLVEDLYIPRARLRNPEMRRWFGETDAWWLDNLRHNISELDDAAARAQALALGLQAGDYVLSFSNETIELKQPLTAVFWRLAARELRSPPGHPHSRTSNLPAEDFINQVRTDLLYLSLPSAHVESAGAEARSEWRQVWVSGGAAQPDDDIFRLMTAPQSKQAYLAMVDRLLRSAAAVRTWAIGYQEVGLVSARDISELIKEHRPVRATYSKDLTEVAGGLHNYIIVADRMPGR